MSDTSLSQQDMSQLFIRVGQLALKERATAPLTPTFGSNLPRNLRKSVGGIFVQAANPELPDAQKEQLLLGVLRELPQNPFVAFRLACLYVGCGSVQKARTMMEKALYLAASQKIDPPVLLNS